MLFDWYWIVATNPTQRWSSKRGIYVATSDATYVAWLAADPNNIPTNIDTEANLQSVISSIALSTYLGGTGHGLLTNTGGAVDIVLTNPLVDVLNLAIGAAGKTVTLPQMNLPTSRPIGTPIIINNRGSTNSFALNDFNGAPIATIVSSGYAIIYNTSFATTGGVIDTKAFLSTLCPAGQFITSINALGVGVCGSVSTTSVPFATTDTTDASSPTTGALQSAGGAGIAKKLYVGTDLAVNGNTTLGNAASDTIVLTAKSITKPNFPAFSAYNSVGDANVTGDGTAATADLDTELFDRGADFASDTFTDPITGIYFFSGTVQVSGIGAGHTSMQIDLFINSATPFVVAKVDPQAFDDAGVLCIPFSYVLSLAATNTVVLRVKVSGSTKTVAVSSDNTLFSGFLIG